MKKSYFASLLVFGIVAFAPPKLSSQSSQNALQPNALRSDSAVKAQYLKNCAGCHGERGQGLPMAPNLTDDYWIHGGSAKNVTATIQEGVPGKGMLSWKLVFSPEEIQAFSRYVVSLRGTNPPKAKKPEGELYEEHGTRPGN